MIASASAPGPWGKWACKGGAGTQILGVILHHFIAFSPAIHCVSSRRLPSPKTTGSSCGPFFGIAVFLVMNLVVLPLSVYH